MLGCCHGYIVKKTLHVFCLVYYFVSPINVLFVVLCKHLILNLSQVHHTFNRLKIFKQLGLLVALWQMPNLCSFYKEVHMERKFKVLAYI